MPHNTIEITLPKSLEIYRRGLYIEIVRKWFGRKTLLITTIVIFYSVFFLMSYMKGYADGDPMFFHVELSLQLAVGIGLIYYALASWLNQTHIRVGQGNISVQHKPIPWLGNKTLNVSGLKQLYSEERVWRKDAHVITYEVHALTRGDRSLKLVTGLDSKEQAVYIEQKIENHLHVKNIPVEGEIGRS